METSCLWFFNPISCKYIEVSMTRKQLERNRNSALTHSLTHHSHSFGLNITITITFLNYPMINQPEQAHVWTGTHRHSRKHSREARIYMLIIHSNVINALTKSQTFRKCSNNVNGRRAATRSIRINNYQSVGTKKNAYNYLS